MATNAELSASIQKADKASFLAWASKPENKQRLDIPVNPLRFLIAPRIYDFAENPANVQQRVAFSQKNELHFYNIEREKDPLTDIDQLKAYDASFQDRINALRGGREFPLPKKADYFHIQYSDDVYQGALGLNDFVFESVMLDVLPNGNLYVTSYRDRPELRRKGIGLSFYKRLREFAQETGFRFISGNNDEKEEVDSNYSFFTEKLGRKRFDELPKHVRNLLADQEDRESGVFTVECLDPRDL